MVAGRCYRFRSDAISANGAIGRSDIEGKAAREAVSERSRGDASDIDGQTERSKWAGAHESTWAASEFQWSVMGSRDIDGETREGERAGSERVNLSLARVRRQKDHQSKLQSADGQRKNDGGIKEPENARDQSIVKLRENHRCAQAANQIKKIAIGSHVLDYRRP